MLDVILLGFVSGSAILIGSLFGLYLKISNKITAAVMAFGAGVLISALSIDLMSGAFEKTHDSIIIGLSFFCGALVFVMGDYLIDSKGGHFRKHSHGILEQSKAKKNVENSGMAILLGTFLDGIPESFVVGASAASESSVGIVFVIAVFISNLPEGMSGTLGMKMAGMPPKRILLLWTSTLIVTIISAIGGYLFLADASPEFHAATMAFASGAILAMLCDTMIPEAFKFGGRFVALVTICGFLLAFLLSKAV